MKFKISFLIAVLASCALTSCTQNNIRQSYVDLNQLYNDFEYRKILEAELKSALGSEQASLDSIQLQLGSIERKAQTVKIDELEAQRYYELKAGFDQRQATFLKTQEELTTSYDTKLWSQLNQYVNDYCKENNISFLLGANGSGVVMYADTAYDITNQLSQYCNKRFRGQ